jgi:predicted flap endonuclease-1-like 5' DNA nuclease
MNVDLLWWFAAGLLLGWLIEWLIDRIYWRRRLIALESDFKRRATEIERLRADLDTARADADSAARLRVELDKARADAADADARHKAVLDGARADAADAAARAKAELTAARSDAARFKSELDAARTAAIDADARHKAELAAAGAAAVAAAAVTAQTGDREQLAERDALIQRYQQREAEQQRALVAMRDALARSRSELSEASATAQQLRVAAGAGAEPERQGLALGAAAGDGPSVSQQISGLQVYLEQQRREAEQLRADLQQERALRLAAVLPGGDPLIDIDGIGPVYQKKLYDAGITSFAGLGALTPEQVREIVQPRSWQEIDAAAWIAEARTRAASVRRERDPLIDINGIGPVYERKLQEAGINTFAELAVLTADQVRAIVQPQEWQQLDIEAWLKEARELAIQVRAGTYRKGVV